MDNNLYDTPKDNINNALLKNNSPALIADHEQHWKYFSGFPLFMLTLSILLFLIYSYSKIFGHISDEGFHAGMIDAFLRKEWDNLPTNVTTPPFFHAVIAFFVHISGVESKLLEAMRAAQFVISLGAIPCFYFIAAQLKKNDSDMRMLLCLTMPAYIPLFGVVYTDPPAVTFTMLMVLFMLKGNHWLAALMAIVGIGIRQMTVIWACFCALYTLIELAHTYHVQGRLKSALTSATQWFKAAWLVTPYLLPAAVFIAFTLYNGGVVAGDQAQHPTSLNMSNFFFFLLVSFLIFMPIVIGSSKDVFKFVLSRPWVWFFIPVMLVLLVIYLYSYEIRHAYNHPNMHWWIHNLLLKLSTQNFKLKILFFIPIVWMLLTYIYYAVTHSKPWQMILLYIFGLLSFVPLPLVEARYYIVFLLLFILWKPRQSDFCEKISLAYMLLLSFYVINGTSMRYFFL